MKKISIALFFLVFFFSCQNKALNEDELVKYTLDESNGLIKTKSIGDLKISVLYRPNDLIIGNEIKGSSISDTAEIEKLKANFSKYFYFILSINRSDNEIVTKNADVSTTDHLQKVLFNMGDYVKLLGNGSDTLNLIDFTFPRTYGTTRSSEFLFVFEKKQIEKHKYLLFCLDDFGTNTGSNKFRFEMKDILGIPKLSKE